MPQGSISKKVFVELGNKVRCFVVLAFDGQIRWSLWSTMVMVGMNDLRTPPSESKQLYHALKLRKVETILVEIPEASHGIANRPSNLMTKIAHTLAWFDRYTTQ